MVNFSKKSGKLEIIGEKLTKKTGVEFILEIIEIGNGGNSR